MNIVYHHRTRSTDAQRIHIQEIVDAFRSLGHEVELVSLVPTDAGQKDAKRDAGEPWWQKMVRRIPFGYEAVQLGYNAVGLPMLLVKLLRKHTDFIYERYSLFNFTGVLAARMAGVPIVLEVNSPFALEQSRDLHIRAHRFAQWTERAICNMATRVIVVSGPLRRILEEAGVSGAKIEVMTNGVRMEHFRPEPAAPELRHSLGIGYHDVVIGFVGWFRNWHGLETLLEAFHQSRLADEGAKVMLIGDGPAMPGLRAYVEKEGLAGKVIFTGPIPHADVPRHLNLIDIAVQPAANEYCCPMKILEYMALGKAIVAPRQPNIQEVLGEDEAQFFTPGSVESMAQALAALVRDRARRRTLGERAQRAIALRRLSWEANAQRVVTMVGGESQALPSVATR